jgi:ribulose 1,5-bisphosphate synthetase/thiazole synthase
MLHEDAYLCNPGAVNLEVVAGGLCVEDLFDRDGADVVAGIILVTQIRLVVLEHAQACSNPLSATWAVLTALAGHETSPTTTSRAIGRVRSFVIVEILES